MEEEICCLEGPSDDDALLPLRTSLEPILALCDAARYLAAKRLFDEWWEEHQGLVEWREEEEGCACSVNRAGSRAVKLMQLRAYESHKTLAEASLTTAEHDKWVLASTVGGITCHYYVEEDGIVTVRMQGSMKELPLFEQAAVIHEVDFFRTWIPLMTDSLRVQKLGHAELIAYLSVWFPPIGRDTVIHAYAADCLNEHDTILILGKSVETWPGAPLKECGWFHDRMDVQKFTAIIHVSAPDSAVTTIVAKVDPRTILPHAVVNLVVRNLAGLMLYYFQQKVQEVVRSPEGDVAQRIRANPGFYLHWLLPKLVSYCQYRGWPAVTPKYFQDDGDVLPAVTPLAPMGP